MSLLIRILFGFAVFASPVNTHRDERDFNPKKKKTITNLIGFFQTGINYLRLNNVRNCAQIFLDSKVCNVKVRDVINLIFLHKLFDFLLLLQHLLKRAVDLQRLVMNVLVIKTNNKKQWFCT